MNYSFRYPSGMITEAYARGMARNVGKTNDRTGTASREASAFAAWVHGAQWIILGNDADALHRLLRERHRAHDWSHRQRGEEGLGDSLDQLQEHERRRQSGETAGVRLRAASVRRVRFRQCAGVLDEQETQVWRRCSWLADHLGSVGRQRRRLDATTSCVANWGRAEAPRSEISTDKIRVQVSGGRTTSARQSRLACPRSPPFRARRTGMTPPCEPETARSAS